jgi:dipeptidyl aminopeptidase/acylaminoacyl peptidase
VAARRGTREGEARAWGCRKALTLLVALCALTPIGCSRERPGSASQGSSAPQPLTVTLVWHLGVSPSGKWLTFESMLQRGPQVAWSVSWLMPATGGSARPLELTMLASSFPVWSPVADEVAYVRVGETSTVRLRRPEEAEPRLSLDFADLWLSELCWSADGSRLACLATALAERRRDPLLIDIGSGERHFARLRVPATVSPLLFRPDGGGLIFAREGTPQGPGREPQLYLMEASTVATETKEIGNLEATLCQAAVPVGDSFILQLLHYPPGTTEPQARPHKELALFKPGEPPTFTPLGDGSFASAQSLRRRDGHLELAFERSGDLFLLPLTSEGAQDVTRVTETAGPEAGAIFSPDGQALYYVRSTSAELGPTEVVCRNLSDKQETVLARVTPELVKQAAAPSP